jgi:hypothetical protein
VSTMPKRDNVSTGRRPSPRASPVPAGRAHSAGAKSVVTFTLSDVEWERIRSTRDWSEDVDWRREIEQIGQDFWELRAFKEMWVNELRGKHPAKQREKIRKAGILMRRSQEVLAELANDGLLGDDFSPPNLNWPEPRFKEWLSEYEFWVQPFAGRSDPIQSDLEWRLMNLWKRSGGKLAYSKKKDDPGTPLWATGRFSYEHARRHPRQGTQAIWGCQIDRPASRSKSAHLSDVRDAYAYRNRRRHAMGPRMTQRWRKGPEVAVRFSNFPYRFLN